MCKHTFVEGNIPKEHRVIVHHFHSGNSSKKFRHGRDYMTTAILLDKEGKRIGSGRAHCSGGDAPTRAIGRAVAIGRAMKQAYKTREVFSLVEKVA
jgi:hypothetical protein